MTNEELAAEVERRLQAGTMGFHGLYSTNQQDFREMWRDALDYVNDMCNADFERWQPVRQMMLDAEARHGGDRIETRRQVYAVNTTYYGEQAEKDHQPK